jgi:hypothetical protein
MRTAYLGLSPAMITKMPIDEEQYAGHRAREETA